MGVIFIGVSYTSVRNTLIGHAILAPLIFLVVSQIYFKKFHYTSPITTAAMFSICVFFLNFFVVPLLIAKSQDVLQGLFGMWIPIFFIFLVTYLIGEKISWELISDDEGGIWYSLYKYDTKNN
jgi:hypothetical protein